MKRKAVVRLLAGTVCVATLTGSILPNKAVVYAEKDSQTEGEIKTDTEDMTVDVGENLSPDKQNIKTTDHNSITKQIKEDAIEDSDITDVKNNEESSEGFKEEPKSEAASREWKVIEAEIPEESENYGATVVTVENATELQNVIDSHNGGITIYLKNKIEVNKSVIIQKSDKGKTKQVTICSNEAGINRRIYLGEAMRNKADSDMFKVKDGCTLTFGNNNGGVIQLDGGEGDQNVPHGGCLINVNEGCELFLYGTKLMNNKNQNGYGSGLLNNGTAYLESVQVLNNRFNTESQYFTPCTNDFDDIKYCVGGGLKNAGVMTVVNCIIKGNQATCGGGIYTSGSENGSYAYTVIKDSDITGNMVSDYGKKSCARGGGIAVVSKTDKSKNCGVLTASGRTKIHGNSSSSFAAGVYNNGLCSLYDSVICENTAPEHAAVWNGAINSNVQNKINGVQKAQGSMDMNSVNIYGNISGNSGKAAVTNNGDMVIAGGNIHENNRIGISNNGTVNLTSSGEQSTQICGNNTSKAENTGGVRNSSGGTLNLGYASVYANTGHGLVNSGTVNVMSGYSGNIYDNTKNGICNNKEGIVNIAGSTGIRNNAASGISNEGTLNITGSAEISDNGTSGISNMGTMDVSGNLTVKGAKTGLSNSGTVYLRSVAGSIKSSGSNAIDNKGQIRVSGQPEIKSDATWSVFNREQGMLEVSGQPQISGKKPVLNRGTLKNNSKIRYGTAALANDTAVRHESGNLLIAESSVQDALHDIFLKKQQYVTIYGALHTKNILAPSEYEPGRKVAEVTYGENSHTVAENSLGLKDTSTGFVLCGCSKINLTEANKKVRGGLNGAALGENDVILSKKYNVTYNSGLPDEINCTMPENRKLYWCEDTIIGKKPQISDKAKRYVHQFLGWYDEDGKEYQEGDKICVDRNLVLTAKWEMSCNIAYHGNGQTVGDDYTQEKDKSLIISDTEMYKFDGKFYKGLVGDDTFQRTETYKKDEDGNLLDKNGKKTDEKHAAKLTSLNPDTGKEDPCEEQYSVKEWATQPDIQKEGQVIDKNEIFKLNAEHSTSYVYDKALNTTDDKGENLCITYDAPDNMVQKGREEKPADKLTLGVKKQDAAVYGASQGKMTSGTWLNMYAVWDKFPQLDAYNRYFTLKQAENGEITTEALLTTLRFKDEEDTDGKYLYSKDYAYDKKENCIIIKGKDGATMKLRAETDMDTLLETGEGVIRYTLTDSAGNITTKEVQCSIVDTSDIPKEYDTYVRFISPKYYKKNGAYVPKENGGLEENSIWKTDPEYVALLDKAMSNEKRGIKKKSVRVFGVKFEADDPGSGTWDYEEETWEFTHEQVKSVDDFVDKHGYMNYKEKDGLKKFREEYKDCIK